MSNSTKRQALIVTQEYQIDGPLARRAWLIPTSAWEDLRHDVTLLEAPSPLLDAIGAGVLGFGLTSILTGLTIDEKRAILGIPACYICFILAAAAVAAGICMLVIAYARRKALRVKREDVLRQMERIERDNNPEYRVFYEN